MKETYGDYTILRPDPEPEQKEETAEKAVKKHPVEDACDSLIPGYFFLFVNIYIFTLNILPPFVGYGLLLDGIRKLKPERESIALLEPLAKVLVGTSLAEWLMALISFPNPLQPIWWLTGLLDLYFHYQLLTDLAETAEETGPEGIEKPVRKLKFLRSVYLVLRTTTILLFLPRLEALQNNTAVMTGSVILFILLALNLWVCLADIGIQFQRRREAEESREA